MGTIRNAERHALVVQPEEGPSYWQPVPANGYADPKLFPANTQFEGLSMGFQTIPPGSRVREHSHADQVELQICFQGKGHVVVDGVSHPLKPGTSCFLGYRTKHEIINDSDNDLVMLYVITRPGSRISLRLLGALAARVNPHQRPLRDPTMWSPSSEPWA